MKPVTEPKTVEVKIDPRDINNATIIRKAALRKAGLPNTPEIQSHVIRRSIDARSRSPQFVCQVQLGEAPQEDCGSIFCPEKLTGKRVVIVGAGPAGYFAALTLLEKGIKPIILERGKDVTTRRYDLKKIQADGVVDPNSNYCFGEGGAGTYSDGKLYTRATKRGNVKRILNLFIENGANPDIRIDAHPHLGSNMLPRIVSSMRESIIAAGGEIHFGAQVTDLIIDGDTVKGAVLDTGERVDADAVILATGHSARDIFHMLVRNKVAVEAKPFALGVRIEHPQPLIDQIFYHQSPRHENLPAASYRITTQVEERGVFSFCMCPGGFVVPASTAPGELVLNGMSMSSRSAPFANAGLVVEIRLDDVGGDPSDPLAALAFQAAVEKNMFKAGDGTSQKAPAQRVGDFIAGKTSGSLPESSYVPGLYSAPLNELLPHNVADRLAKALPVFGRKYKGFDSNEAKMMAVESRTSSPVRVLRDRKTLEHPSVRKLYPCGEGAGYAGGIVSAAIDGERVATSVAASLCE
ncbi:NAD(P)/FAD-dependent oxidoreductase [Halodesulfovibrio aestuarii]|uniref:NAD(P)/FAD-dependent oxidoreductase n=1 Tax=Halodesulfovibrio aestuarii TaxID=126333 RepID=UPI0035219D39